MGENGKVPERETAQWALRERVKELTCLYGIARVADRPDLSLEDVARSVVDLLPPAWQYPEVTAARILMDGAEYLSSGFAVGPHRQFAPVGVRGTERGSVEVFYLQDEPEADEGPFLKEERSLINEVAHQLGLMLERRQAEGEKARLQEQLWRADRLATIGKLAAGVAHELNEPLGVILGNAQLQLKTFGLPDQTGRDLEKIVKASLHAREIVKKLLLFSRQMPSEKVAVKIDDVVREAMYLLEARSKKACVQVVLRLAKGLPEVRGDPGQLQQVVLNLGVNAIQSMPSGGTLRFIAEAEGDKVLLAVEDTGIGMPPDVRERVFDPFFTTKDVGQGTGLGLSVVHGIVAAHGGTIRAESEVGRGSRFEILLPCHEEGG